MTKHTITCKNTRAVQTHRILPFHCNTHNTLYGGRLMEFIDNCASISYSRYYRGQGVTASMDNLNFINPLPENHSVCVETFASGAGSRSVEIFAKVIGENLDTGQRYLAATAFLTFVTLKSDGSTADIETPSIQPETEEENYVVEGYPKRRAERLQKRKDNASFNENISLEFPW